MVIIQVSDAQAAEISHAIRELISYGQAEDESAMFYIAELIDCGRKAIKTREATLELI